MRFGFLLSGHCCMQIGKLLFRICVAAVKTTTTRRRQHGGSVSVCVCVCVYDSKGGAAQITITTVCVCVSVCVDVQKFATGSGWGLSTEKITVEVSQRFGKEYMSFINSFLLYLIDDSLILICVFTSRLAMLLPFTAIHKILKMDTLRVTKFTKIPN